MIGLPIELYNKSKFENHNGTFIYAKHGNLLDADASGAKASTKHLESRINLKGLLSVQTKSNMKAARKPHTYDAATNFDNLRRPIEFYNGIVRVRFTCGFHVGLCLH